MSDSPLRPRRGTARPPEVARRFRALLREGKDVRWGLVRRVRESIAAGRYENDLKLEVAAERVVSELRRETKTRI